MNQILEDMLRACVLIEGKDWDNHLPLAEFAYNNSYQASIQMVPFEALCEHKCRTPLNWSVSGERVIFGPDLVTDVEECVKIIQANVMVAQSRQKSYVDKRRRSLSFEANNELYL